jgi:hypothetical protein
MEEYLKGSWQDFENWIRSQIGSNFRWKVRPMDTPSKRRMVAELILANRERHNGVLPESDTFIEIITNPAQAKEVDDDG